jgi:TatD DNase family protein
VGFLTDTHCHLNLNIFKRICRRFSERPGKQGVQPHPGSGDRYRNQPPSGRAGRTPPEPVCRGWRSSRRCQYLETDTLSQLRELAQHPKTAAIGEIGLDYYRDRSPRPLQRNVFWPSLNWQPNWDLPVVIHNRESLDDLWSTLTKPGIINLAAAASPLAERPGVLALV